MAKKTTTNKTDDKPAQGEAGKRAASHALGDKQTYDWPVELTNSSGNKNSCSIGLVIPRKAFKNNLNTVDKLLRHARLQVTIKLVGDDGETPLLIEGVPTINEAAEIHGLSIKDDESVTTRITFDADDDLQKNLIDYRYKNARMIFARTGDAGKEPAGAAQQGDDPNQMSLGADDPSFDDAA